MSKLPLADFNPRWLVDKDGRQGMGMSLRCPSCRLQRLSVWFSNPVDGLPAYPAQEIPPDATEEVRKRITAYNNRWGRTGEDFSTLSLSPSIDASGAGHWHGFITEGFVSGSGPCASQVSTPAG